MTTNRYVRTTDSKTPHLRLRTAWHEAGHAAIAMMNYHGAVDYVEVYSYKRTRNNSLGFCKLNVKAHVVFDEYMPAEYIVAGVAAEAVLTGLDPLDIWEDTFSPLHNEHGDAADLFHQYPQCRTLDNLVALLDRTCNILQTHKKQLRMIAKRLMRKGWVGGYRGGYLWQVGQTLTPMPNPELLADIQELEGLFAQLKAAQS